MSGTGMERGGVDMRLSRHLSSLPHPAWHINEQAQSRALCESSQVGKRLKAPGTHGDTEKSSLQACFRGQGSSHKTDAN